MHGRVCHFRQQLDDIAFNIAKIDVFGRSMKHDALSKCFLVEFEKQPFSLRRRMNWFLKTVYFLNLMTMMGELIYVTMRQDSGDFHPQSIMITMGEQVSGVMSDA